MEPPRPCTRDAASGVSWAEVFVTAVDAAVTATAADALAGSHSLMLFDAVATPSECALLCDAASAAARERTGRTHDGDGQTVQTGRFRGQVEECLDSESQMVCDRILCRAVAHVGAALPALLPRFFGELDLRESVLYNKGLVFSAGEPAINVYTSGGAFDPHTDKQSLTLLVPLSCARDGGAGGDGGTGGDGAAGAGTDRTASLCADGGSSYDGGGTAFFRRDGSSTNSTPADVARGAVPPKVPLTVPPTVVVRPAAGTAIAFCGDVRHAGEPVLGGTRKRPPHASNSRPTTSASLMTLQPLRRSSLATSSSLT